jgi:hypothetical protein
MKYPEGSMPSRMPRDTTNAQVAMFLDKSRVSKERD